MTTDQGATAGSLAADEERSKRKRRAFLAVGLVVGLGVGATLAVMSTNIFGTATFQTADWGLEASFDTTTWIPPDAATDTVTGAFAFPVALPNIAPDVPVYAPIWVRSATGKNAYDSLLGFTGVTKTGGTGGAAADGAELFSALTVTIAEQDACSDVAGLTGTPSAGWPAGATFASAAPTAAGEELPIDKVTENPTKLCLEVVLPAASDSVETRGALVNVEFGFTGTAVIP